MRAAVVLTSMVLAAQPAVSAERSSAQSLFLWGTAGTTTTVEDVDAAINLARQAVWDVPEQLLTKDDGTGRRLEQDLAEHFLPERTLGPILALRDEVAKTHPSGAAVPSAVLEPLKSLLLAETCKFAALMEYWAPGAINDYHQDLLRQLVDRLPAPERGDATARINAVAAGAAARRDRLMPNLQYCESQGKSDGSDVRPRSAVGEFNALRLELAGRLPSTELGPPTMRPTSCPAPVEPSPGSTRVAVRKIADPYDYYPPSARQRLVEGSVRVRIEYDATGCVVAVGVAESSGSTELDQAAIAFSFETVLATPEIDGKRSGGVVLQRVNFRLVSPDALSPSRN
jgi:TonB family protein